MINPSRKENWEILNATTYPHNFGVLIPCSSGVIWEQQTDGVMCHHVHIEGIFIPLQKPRDIDLVNNKDEDLLHTLQEANYNYDSVKAEKTWKRIQDIMHFEFEEIPNPDPSKYPDTQEGMKWIKVKKFEDGWGHCPWVRHLEGKTLILIYPNCD